MIGFDGQGGRSLIVLSTLVINILILHKHCLRSSVGEQWSWRPEKQEGFAWD